jgi:Uncharacterized conserved protein (DUF2285)
VYRYRSIASLIIARSFPSHAERHMAQPPLDPPVADFAPDAETLTPYDHEHLVTYVRLLDAEAEGADWTAVARLVLHIDPSAEPARGRRAWESHLARAKWMTEHGYRHLLRGDSSN